MHHIQKFSLAIDFFSQDEAIKFQERISSLAKNEMLFIIDEVFDEVSKENFLIQIEEITLDLGDVYYWDLESEILLRLRQQLRSKLQDLVAKAIYLPDEAHQAIVPQQASIAILNEFLQNGTIPYWAEKAWLSFANQSNEPFSLQAVFRKNIEENAENLLQIIKQNFDLPANRLRLIKQVDENLFWLFFNKLLPTQILFFKDAKQALQTWATPKYVEANIFKEIFWTNAFQILFNRTTTLSKDLKSELIEQILENLATKISIPFIKLLEDLQKSKTLASIQAQVDQLFEAKQPQIVLYNWQNSRNIAEVFSQYDELQIRAIITNILPNEADFIFDFVRQLVAVLKVEANLNEYPESIKKLAWEKISEYLWEHKNEILDRFALLKAVLLAIFKTYKEAQKKFAFPQILEKLSQKIPLFASIHQNIQQEDTENFIQTWQNSQTFEQVFPKFNEKAASLLVNAVLPTYADFLGKLVETFTQILQNQRIAVENPKETIEKVWLSILNVVWKDRKKSFDKTIFLQKFLSDIAQKYPILATQLELKANLRDNIANQNLSDTQLKNYFEQFEIELKSKIQEFSPILQAIEDKKNAIQKATKIIAEIEEAFATETKSTAEIIRHFLEFGILPFDTQIKQLLQARQQEQIDETTFIEMLFRQYLENEPQIFQVAVSQLDRLENTEIIQRIFSNFSEMFAKILLDLLPKTFTLFEEKKNILSKFDADIFKLSGAEKALLAKLNLDIFKLSEAEKTLLAKMNLDIANLSEAEKALLAKMNLDVFKLSEAEKALLAKLNLDITKLSEAEKALLAKMNLDIASLSQEEKALLAKMNLDIQQISLEQKSIIEKLKSNQKFIALSEIGKQIDWLIFYLQTFIQERQLPQNLIFEDENKAQVSEKEVIRRLLEDFAINFPKELQWYLSVLSAKELTLLKNIDLETVEGFLSNIKSQEIDKQADKSLDIENESGEQQKSMEELEKLKKILEKTKPKIRQTPKFGETYFIQNAGLVILHPYLGRFFKMLNLTNKNEFIDTDTQQRAIHLLQYLANKTEQPEEHELILNKLLCGWELTEPIEREIVLSDEEKETAEGLLEGVIANWEIIKNSSVDNLRFSFLFREGKLEETKQNWILKVEQKGIDVLLEKIPWGFGTIKLPWMPKLISVEWM